MMSHSYGLPDVGVSRHIAAYTTLTDLWSRLNDSPDRPRWGGLRTSPDGLMGTSPLTVHPLHSFFTFGTNLEYQPKRSLRALGGNTKYFLTAWGGLTV